MFPPGPTLPAAAARDRLARRRLAALGIVRTRRWKDPADRRAHPDVGESATVEGVRGEWRIDPVQLDRGFEGRVALLSPPDQLVFDRDRIVDLFAFLVCNEGTQPQLSPARAN